MSSGIGRKQINAADGGPYAEIACTLENVNGWKLRSFCGMSANVQSYSMGDFRG